MKKIVLSALLCALLSAIFTACGKGSVTSAVTSPSTSGKDTSKVTPQSTVVTTTTDLTEDAKSAILRVENGYIVNGNNEEVVLTGINIGGWLLQETWMCAVVGSESNSESFETLSSRGFTEEEIKTLFASYADNYIKESDIKNISRLGLNCIRVPFWYRNFMTEELEFYTENADENPGFIYLDRVISWAEKAGIYVILDLHGAPGGQSTDHSCGIIGENRLYTEEKNLEATERLWASIAERYKNSPTVAAYDILNEPMNNDTSYENGWAAESKTAVDYTIMAYDRFIKAIRKVDTDHIITVEGIWSMSCLPDPKDYGWTNMMYQLHLYDTSTFMIDYRVSEMVSARKKYGVAIYIGEYNNGDENQIYAYEKYSQNKISRTAWTYKTAKGNQGNWSLYYSDTSAADLKNDSYEEILEKWGSTLKTTSKSWTLNTTLRDMLKNYAK